jgi:hypothetical protein
MYFGELGPSNKLNIFSFPRIDEIIRIGPKGEKEGRGRRVPDECAPPFSRYR